MTVDRVSSPEPPPVIPALQLTPSDVVAWKTRTEAFLEASITVRRSAVDRYLTGVDETQRAEVLTALDDSASALGERLLRMVGRQRRIYLTSTGLMLLAAIVLLLWPWLFVSGLSVTGRLVAELIPIGLLAVDSLVTALATRARYAWLRWLIMAVLVGGLVLVAWLPRAIPGYPAALAVGPRRTVVVVTVVFVLAGHLVGYLMAALMRGSSTRFTRQAKRDLPEEVLLDSLSAAVISPVVHGQVPPELSGHRLQPALAVAAYLEDAAASFEQHWPRLMWTGYRRIDDAAEDWSRRVGAAVTGHGLAAIYDGYPLDHLPAQLSGVMASVVLRRPLPAAPPPGDTAQHSPIWRRVGRLVGVSLVGLLALVVLLVALWQPYVPDLLARWGLTDLASAVRGDLRAALLGASPAMLGAFGQLLLFRPAAPTINVRPVIAATNIPTGGGLSGVLTAPIGR